MGEKEDATSPTVSIKSVILTSIIDAKEHRDIAVADIPGAFLHAKMDDYVIMVFCGAMVEWMLEISYETYKPFVHIAKTGQMLLYVQLLRALYGCLKSSRLFWQKLTNDLKQMDFEVNPYDTCMANKIIDGSQMTIIWYVDDLKILHKNPDEVSKIIAWIESKYGDIKPNCGKIHDYLGMTLDFSTPSVLHLSMKDYIENTLDAFPQTIEGSATSPAAAHLFQHNKDCAKLDADKKTEFHTTVAKCFFLCKCARPDIHTAVTFLTTRVQAPDQDDWKKLLHLLKYLKGTQELELTLVAEGNGALVVKWWVDGAFAVHNDMRSHTGVVMSVGRRGAYNSRIKQKLNNRSSTEAELVTANDAMPQILWTNYFLQAQDILHMKLSCFKIISQLFFWKRTVANPVASVRITLISDIFLLKIGLHLMNLQFDSVPTRR